MEPAADRHAAQVQKRGGVARASSLSASASARDDVPDSYRGAATLLKRKAAKLPGGTGERIERWSAVQGQKGQSQCLSSKPSPLPSLQLHSFWRQFSSSAIAKSSIPASSERGPLSGSLGQLDDAIDLLDADVA